MTQSAAAQSGRTRRLGMRFTPEPRLRIDQVIE
jgi:hypothetical protein